MTARRTLVLWGFHPSHGNVPLKIAEWSRAEQDRRTAEGWTCAAYAQGDAPEGLLLLAAAARGHYAEHDRDRFDVLTTCTGCDWGHVAPDPAAARDAYRNHAREVTR